MTIFDMLLINNAVGMIILMVFALIGVSMAKTRGLRIGISIYALLQFVMYLEDFIFISRL